MILTPAHGTLPSGHATEAFVSAYVLWMLLRKSGTVPYRLGSWGVQFMRLAARIAINRTVAGVHFPVDSAAGCLLGLTLGQYFVARCTQPDGVAADYEAWKFDGPSYPTAGDRDFRWHKLYDVATRNQTKTAYAAQIGGAQTLAAFGRSASLAWLWRQARAEWR